MKRLLSVLFSVAIILSIVTLHTSAAASGSFTGATSVKAGDTVKLTFKVVGSDQFSGYEGTLSYDESVLTLKDVASTMTNWTFSRNGNKLLAYKNDSGTVVMGTVFVATFTVNRGVTEGTEVKASFSGEFSGNTDSSRQSISGTYSTKIAAAPSNDATLASLKVSNATLSPAFNPNTTSYSCGTVKFDVSKLGITATANAEGAKVSVSKSNLSVGSNTINITVTAPGGATKTYRITVTREEDPNYKASDNTKLSEIKLSDGKLSPEYSVDIKEYVVYVPYETATITIGGAAADPLAKGVEGVDAAALEVGTNVFELKCTAEDGSAGVYKVYVVRMPEFKGAASIGGAIGSDVTEPETTTEAPVADITQPEQAAPGVSPVIMAVLALVCLVFGIAIGVLITRKKSGNGKDDFDDFDDVPPTTDANPYDGDSVGYIDYDTYMDNQ